jgi:glycosyltransferase involved in cell wall biosynthesis
MQKRIGILIVAYNAVTTLVLTFNRIPSEMMKKIEEIFVFDDHSTDDEGPKTRLKEACPV